MGNIISNFVDYVHHLNRKKRIRDINKLKALSDEEKLKNLEAEFKKRYGYDIDWNNLNKWTELLQYEKFFNRNPMKSVLADKYAVRKWVGEVIGDEYLVPLLGRWERYEDIEFSLLPNKFVLKTNHGSHMLYVVNDKSDINHKKLKYIFNDWLDMDFAYVAGYELHYSGIKPCIIAEEHISPYGHNVNDYKFMCFGGQPYFCQVTSCLDIGEFYNVYDMDWNPQNFTFGGGKKNLNVEFKKPDCLDEMIEITKKLASDFEQVRVDLYNVDNKIYFGEMTFTDGSGYDPPSTNEADILLGDLWKKNRLILD